MIIDLDFDTTSEAEAFHEKLRALWAGAGAGLGLQNPRARIVDVVESEAH